MSGKKCVKYSISVVDADGDETFGADIREGQVDMPDVFAAEEALLNVLSTRLGESKKKA